MQNLSGTEKQKKSTKANKNIKGLVQDVILRFKRLNPHMERTLVALSGGADSIALLYCLSRIKDLDLSACHVRYNIRPAHETLIDKQRAIDAARHCKVDLLTKDINIQEFQSKYSGCENVEKAARDARYRTFSDVLNIRRQSNPGQDFIREEYYNQNKGYIATAHHAEDQAETVLMFLARGTGIGGLAGIKDKQRAFFGYSHDIVRPMLGLSHQDCIDICNNQGLEYAEDSTNDDNTLTRNKIRNEILPLLKEINPKAAEHIACAADIARSAEKVIEKNTARLEMDWEYMSPGNMESVKSDSLRLVEDVVIYDWLGHAIRSLTGGRGLDKLNKKMLDSFVDAVRNRKNVEFNWSMCWIRVDVERVIVRKPQRS